MAKGQAEMIMGNAVENMGWHRGLHIVSTKFSGGLYKLPNKRNMKALDIVPALSADMLAQIDAVAGTGA